MPHIAAAAKALEARNVAFMGAEPQPFPGGQFIAVSDPSGNVIELLQFGA